MRFETEQESINYFCNRLDKHGWTDIIATQADNKYSYYDVEAKYNGEVFRFELKRRNYDSTHFGDSIMEKSKFDKFVDNRSEFKGAYLVSLFTDIITIDNIFNPKDIDFVMANHTTDFNDRNIVKKTMVHYSQQKKFKYE